MKRQVFRWQLKDEAGAVVDGGTCFAWNSAIRAGQDALRDVPGRGMFDRVEPARVTSADADRRFTGDTYAQQWSGPRGTFVVRVERGPHRHEAEPRTCPECDSPHHYSTDPGECRQHFA